MKNPQIKAVVHLLTALLLGFFTASQVNQLLEVTFQPKTLPDVTDTQANMPQESRPLAHPIQAILVPAGAMKGPLYDQAVTELAEIVAQRTGSRPAVLEAPAALPPGPVIAVGTGHSAGQGNFPEFSSAEAFALKSYKQGQDQVLTISGGSRLGELYGLYYLADELRRGISEGELMALDMTVAPAMPYRFVDLGAVGIVPDPASWRRGDYSHHNRAFQEVLLSHPPYVDEQAFLRVEEAFQAYVNRMVSYGYNGIIIDGFLEYVNFDQVGNGLEIYGPDSPYRQRHLALRQKFGRLFEYAHQSGMTVILKTDMVALTGPLETYFTDRLGGIDPSRQELWQVYSLGLEELFAAFPYVDGLMIRIGEAGAVYNLEEWDYYSSLSVTTDQAVEMMLEQLLAVAERQNRKIFFRSWSVGVGPVGNMHTQPQTYSRVLGDVHASRLFVSTKYGMGDFFSYLPVNPTLKIGQQKRIIEFQARREFEAFNVFPNDTAPLYQAALLELLQHNPNIDGVWVWTQDGGPLRAGPMSLYPFHGFWLFTDANVYTAARLAWNPQADLNDLTQLWIRKSLSNEPPAIHQLTQIMFLSRQAVLKGLYISDFAEKQALVQGLEPPPTPLLWDIVPGSSVALSFVYFASRHNVEETVAEGFEAVETVRQMQALASALEPAQFEHPLLYENLLESLAYEENLFETLAWYRKAFLSFYQWLDTGDGAAYQAWTEAYQTFETKKQEHLTRYGQNLDFPAYNFFAAETSLEQAERSRGMAWLARLLLILTGGLLFGGSRWGQQIMPPCRGKNSLRGIWLALVTPWQLAEMPNGVLADRLLIVWLPVSLIGACVLTFSFFRSSYLFAWILLSLFVFIFALILLHPRRFRSEIVLSAAAVVPLLGLNTLFMAVVAVQGPLYFWYLFWTSSGFRFLFLTLAVVCILWIFFVVYAVSRTVFKIPALRAGRNLLGAVSALFVVNGLVIGLIGLEPFLTVLNRQLLLLPVGLSMVLGITTHLNLNPHLPFYLAAGGGMALILGWVASKYIKPSAAE